MKVKRRTRTNLTTRGNTVVKALACIRRYRPATVVTGGAEVTRALLRSYKASRSLCQTRRGIL